MYKIELSKIDKEVLRNVSADGLEVDIFLKYDKESVVIPTLKRLENIGLVEIRIYQEKFKKGQIN